MANNTRDSLETFIALRSSLERERDEIRKRLFQIEEALNESTSVAAAPRSAAPRRGRPPGSKNKPVARSNTAAKTTGVAQNKMTMRDAIAKALSKGPLGIKDVVSQMQKLGYTFKSSNPTNSVGAFLYGPEGKKSFKKSADGSFSKLK